MLPLVLVPVPENGFENYRRGLEAVGCRALFSTELRAHSGCQGLLLPGGGDLEPWRYGCGNTASRDLDPARDARELALLDEFAATGRPVLGICRGLQLINVGFGGTLIQDLPGHSAWQRIDRLHWVQTAPGPFREWAGPGAVVNSAHHQAADRLGSGLAAVQWAPDGTVEALCHRARPIWAVQWHPERLCGQMARPGTVDGRRLLAAFASMCLGKIK